VLLLLSETVVFWGKTLGQNQACYDLTNGWEGDIKKKGGERTVASMRRPGLELCNLTYDCRGSKRKPFMATFVFIMKNGFFFFFASLLFRFARIHWNDPC
jgi:hypothetical protein